MSPNCKVFSYFNYIYYLHFVKITINFKLIKANIQCHMVIKDVGIVTLDKLMFPTNDR